MTVFSIEELTAIKSSEKPTLNEAISHFTDTLPYYSDDEKDTYNFVTGLIEKLKTMSDEQYQKLDLSNVIDTTEPVEQ